MMHDRAACNGVALRTLKIMRFAHIRFSGRKVLQPPPPPFHLSAFSLIAQGPNCWWAETCGSTENYVKVCLALSALVVIKTVL